MNRLVWILSGRESPWRFSAWDGSCCLCECSGETVQMSRLARTFQSCSHARYACTLFKWSGSKGEWIMSRVFYVPCERVEGSVETAQKSRLVRTLRVCMRNMCCFQMRWFDHAIWPIWYWHKENIDITVKFVNTWIPGFIAIWISISIHVQLCVQKMWKEWRTVYALITYQTAPGSVWSGSAPFAHSCTYLLIPICPKPYLYKYLYSLFD